MKKFLLPAEGAFYKMSAHTHSTRSDGRLTPEEVKARYQEKGYQIVAYTDHDVMMPIADLTDENFVAISAMELEIRNHENPKKLMHLNLLSRDPHKDWTYCYNPEALKENVPVNERLRASLSEKQKEILPRCLPPEHTTECINRVIAQAKEEGYLVIYNHPVWSCHDYNDYIGLKGLWGVEWFNAASNTEGLVDSFQPIKDLLLQGENVFPIAADDMHNETALGKGFLIVKTEKLEYGAIMDALERGDFYSSSGPKIEMLYYEDGFLYVRTDRPAMISVNSSSRFEKYTAAYLTEAKYDVTRFLSNPANKDGYLRVSVMDESDHIAYTRAYRCSEFE